MKIYGNPLNGSTKGLLFDIDETVYPVGSTYRQIGDQDELAEIAALLALDVEAAKERIATERTRLSRERNVPKVTLTDTLYSLGVTHGQWSDLRSRVWKPEKYLKADPILCMALGSLRKRYQIAFGTNSALAIGERILCTIGILGSLPEVRIFGPENVKFQKPDMRFFQDVAQEFGLSPANCVSIGDREFADIYPAIKAGYVGAVQVDGRDEVIKLGAMLLNQQP